MTVIVPSHFETTGPRRSIPDLSSDLWLRYLFPREKKQFVEKLFLGGMLLLGLVMSGPSSAEQWYLEPKVSLKSLYDDNLRLVSKDEESTFGAILRGEARAGVRAETYDIAINSAVDVERYSDISDYDTEDFYFDLSSRYRSGLNEFGLDGAWDLDTNQQSELETSGRVQFLVDRDRRFLSPSWTRTLSERASVTGAVGYTDLDWSSDSDALRAGLFDYTYAVANASWDYQLTETITTTARFDYGRYEADDIQTKTDNYNGLLGASIAFSETLSASLAGGYRYTQSEFIDNQRKLVNESDTGYLIDSSLSKRFERSTLTARLSRSTQPSGQGNLVETTRVSVNWDYKISPRWLFTLNAAKSNIKTARDQLTTDDERDYHYFSPKILWRATPWWAISGSYRYRDQEYQDTNRSATSNAVYLTIAYTWPKESVSKWSVY